MIKSQIPSHRINHHIFYNTIPLYFFHYFPLLICHCQNQDADALHYAALSLNRNRKQNRQEDNVDSVCVYSRIKSRKETRTLPDNNSQD